MPDYASVNQPSETMAMEPWHYWLIAAIVLCILEIFTTDFLLLGLGFAAVGASIASYYEASMTWQVGVFAILSVVFVFTIRPIAKRHLYKTSDPRVTNVDALKGMRGVVVEAIPENGQAGRVKLGGEEWRAVISGANLVDVPTLAVAGGTQPF